MEESFPRGGGGNRLDSASAALRTPAKEQKSSSATKRKTTAASASAGAGAAADKDDFLFGSRSTSTLGEGGGGKRQKCRKSSAAAAASAGGDASGASSSMLPLGGGAVLQPTAFDPSNRGKDGHHTKAALIEALSFNKLGKGTRLLGLIRDVAPDYAVVSLPNMLTGFVRRAKDTDIALTDVYTPGTMMAFSIVKTTTETVAAASSSSSSSNVNKSKTETRRRIELTASPQVINADLRLADLDDGDAATTIRGRIVSCEDHGCIVDLGLAGLGRKMAFLRYENVEGGYDIAAASDEEDGDDEDMEEDSDSDSESDGESEDDDKEMEDGNDHESEDKGKEKRTKSGKDKKVDGTNGATKFILNAGRIYDFTIKSIPTALLSSSDATTGAGGAAVVQLSLRKASSLARVATSLIPTSASTGYTVRTLRPGMLLKCHVEHYARNGLCVTFLGNVFRGSIDMANLGGYWSGVGKMDGVKDANLWWKDVFVGKLKTISARLIAVDPATKIIRLSLLPHVLALSAPASEEKGNAPAAPPPSVGSIIANARVIRHDPGVGALIALPSDSNDDDDAMDVDDDDGNAKVFGGSAVAKLLSNDTYRAASSVRTAYVHISKAVDPPTKEKGRNYRTPEALFAKHFALHAKVPRLRILSTSNLMDNIASCATAESIVASAALSYSELIPGTKYVGVPIIRSMDGGGILVELGHGIRGLVPANHLFDKAQSSGKGGSSYRSKVRAEKYRVGNKIDVRCLQVDEDARRCILTAKKTLVQSDPDDPITDYATIKAGKVATGFISTVNKSGVTVTFYNNVYGKVTARRLAEELGVEDPSTNYHVGDVIRARVISCHRYKLDLSLNISVSDNDGVNKRPSKAGTKLEPGSIVEAKCMKIVQLFGSRLRDDGVSFIPGHAVVTIKAKRLNIDDEGQSVDCKIPFDQILDTYDADTTESAEGLDRMARRVLKVGKKINQAAVVIFSGNDGTSGGKVAMPVVSLRPAMVKTAKAIAESEEGSGATKVSLPSPETSLYQGAIVQGYCTRLDPRYGAFVRFLNGLTGLIPKLKGGLDVNLFDTVLCRISALDVTSGSRPKILLKRLRSVKDVGDGKQKSIDGKEADIKVDEIIGGVRVEDVNFARATVSLLDDKYQGAKVRARIHFTMAVQPSTPRMPVEKPMEDDNDDGNTDASKAKISSHHPFYKWSPGDVLHHAKCVAVENRNGTLHIELAVTEDSSKVKANKKKSRKGASAYEDNPTPTYVSEASHLPAGTAIAGVITRVCSQNRGVWIHVCPGTTGFVSGMELSDDIDILNNLKQYYKVGGVLNCSVMEKRGKHINKNKRGEDEKAEQSPVYASALHLQGNNTQSGKPATGDLVIGRINRNLKPQHAPALMLELRGGYEARCDITELDEMDEWENMPLGRLDAGVIGSASNTPDRHQKEKNSAVVTDESADDNDDSGDEDSIMSEDEEDAVAGGSDYPTGKYVRCRVLSGFKSASAVEVSLRESRLDGDLEDDEAPEPKEMVHAYVISTNKKGCFVRLSRFVEGRVILKELADGFLPDPAAMFPQGRLVIGKVKEVRHLPKDSKKGKKYVAKTTVDLDMRESTLLEDEDKITYEDIKIGEKYKGTVTRVEPYGVFVRLENSEMTGLAHLSECSDNYIKNLADLYDPGDLVKALVIKKDEEKNRFGLSLKASHFEDDSESEDDDESTSSSESGSDAGGVDDALMNDVLVSDAENDGVNSDDENFASKLAAKMKGGDEEDDGSSDEESSSSSSSDDSDEDGDEEEENRPTAMDTDVGFNWESKHHSTDESSSDDSDDDGDNDEIDNAGKSSHKARKKAAARRKEEKEISARESALADGTADYNPETSADFERLLAADPNASENWIRYMAYHLSLADIDSARNVANRAFDRIEFRQEDEKLNVWTALLTLEFKYGTPKSQQATIDRASQHNNPKKVYLRVCEMLEREVDASISSSDSSDRAQSHDAAVARADEMFLKMCKKFKSKKTVWIAHLKYLLKGARHEEAHALLKRALQSLPEYKHVETMSRFAQLEFEHGSPERARTIYDTLIEKHPKRLDLLFVYVDKEVKHGELTVARNIFMDVIKPSDGHKKKAKYSDKQMKSLFKKWFRIEEEHGDEDSREEVKAAAREFVERTAAAKS